MKRLLAATALVLASALALTTPALASDGERPGAGAAGLPNLPTCTSYSTFHEWGLALHIPTVGLETRRWDCAMGPNRPSSNAGALRVLVYALNTCYGAGLPYDGIYSGQVVEAVKRVQRQHGLWPTGEYEPRLRDAMLWPGFDATGNFQRCV